jgi:hypothetical protein
MLAGPALAGDIESAAGNASVAAFDIVRTTVSTEGDRLLFRMQLSEAAGEATPTATGQTAGSTVYSYVWPTDLDSAQVGFEVGQGTLALAATAHPDFDDTPREDEDGDGDAGNDGALWHSHWVVLVPDEACGPGALKVRDIPEGTSPVLPETWPGLPILIDSPGFDPEIDGETVEVAVPLSAVGGQSGIRYDGVTAALRVSASMHDPLLCVVDVFDIASGDLSLPGATE